MKSFYTLKQAVRLRIVNTAFTEVMKKAGQIITATNTLCKLQLL